MIDAKKLQRHFEETLLRNATMVDDRTAITSDCDALKGIPSEQWPVMVARKDMIAMLSAVAANLAEAWHQHTTDPEEAGVSNGCKVTAAVSMETGETVVLLRFDHAAQQQAIPTEAARQLANAILQAADVADDGGALG